MRQWSKKQEKKTLSLQYLSHLLSQGLLGFLYYFLLTDPWKPQEGINELGSGEWDYRILTIRSRNELGEIAKEFNVMSKCSTSL